jgi:hypothetical protein
MQRFQLRDDIAHEGTGKESESTEEETERKEKKSTR